MSDVTPREIWNAPEPSDRQVWAVCPYVRDLKDCEHCPAWTHDEYLGEKVKRGCRALAEEACRAMLAASKGEQDG